MAPKIRVLFVCVANAARSQLAEALMRKLAPENYEVFSAGTAPTKVDPRTLQALDEIDVDHGGLRSKSIDEFKGQQFDYVITLCDKSAQECQALPGAGEVLAWHFADPVSSDHSNAFRAARAEISERIKMFLLLKSKKH
jgi:protein-tyrosine-phosphatase